MSQVLVRTRHLARRAAPAERQTCAASLTSAAEELLRELAFVYQLTRRVETMLAERDLAGCGAPARSAVSAQ